MGLPPSETRQPRNRLLPHPHRYHHRTGPHLWPPGPPKRRRCRRTGPAGRNPHLIPRRRSAQTTPGHSASSSPARSPPPPAPQGSSTALPTNPSCDPQSRVNTFLHVNHSPQTPRYGVLLCVNGTGSLNSWLKHNVAGALDYQQINDLAAQAPIGAQGLTVLPYGNGAERTLTDKNLGASITGLNFNIHNRTHLFRAAQEGIAFALNYGLQIMRHLGITATVIRAGRSNMFLSPVFRSAVANVTGARVELYDTDGAAGAARAAGLGAKIYQSSDQALAQLATTDIIDPDQAQTATYQDAYQAWHNLLNQQLD